jgi:hypothetical protein
MNGPNKLMQQKTGLESLASYEYPSLIGPFVTFEENEVLWKWPLLLYSQHFIFSVTYEWAQKLMLQNTRL